MHHVTLGWCHFKSARYLDHALVNSDLFTLVCTLKKSGKTSLIFSNGHKKWDLDYLSSKQQFLKQLLLEGILINSPVFKKVICQEVCI